MKSRTNTSGNNSCLSQVTLLKYLKGELSGSEMNSVERHLSGCEMCADELEGLGLLENPEEIDSITSVLNKKIDSTLANENKTYWFSSPLKVAASILVIVAISSLIYYTSTLTSTTNPLSENIIQSEKENDKDSIPSETVIYEDRTESKKEEKTRSQEQDIAENREEKTTSQPDVIIEVDEEVDDDTAVHEMILNEAVGASASPPQPKRMEKKRASQAAKISNILDDNIELLEVDSIVNDNELDSNNAIVSYISFSDEEEEFVEDEIFILVEEMPSFTHKDYKDFREYIANNLKYPETASESGIQGKVFISFIVEPDGSISNVKVVRGIDESLDQEAIRVIESSPRWTPGKQRGKAVRVNYTFPVIFVLQ